MIYTCYGGGFSSIPAYIGDIFGTKQLGAIHGYILTAWMKDTTGSYESSLLFFAGLFVVALVISLLIRVDIKRLRNEQQEGLIPAEPAIAATK
ncbi:hypothetical protein SporoP17a_15360 [Sporosarcina ureae]|nr:hypothetical protein SporoP17a_15360 [Sporosarcina ureae]